MASPAATATTAQPSSPPADNITLPAHDLVANDPFVEVDNDDSAFGGSTSQSDWTSVTSSIYKGVIENGRRYQSLKQGEYWSPADDQQFESVANNHLALLLHDQNEENLYFRSPIDLEEAQILDVGTGNGAWAMDVGDRYPGVTIHAFDLSPPPQPWVAPNVIFEVDDASKPWTWTQQFDMVHMRWLIGSFTDEQWKHVYREAYRNLKPGGWIEQCELTGDFLSDDDTIPRASTMFKWGSTLADAANNMGNRIDVMHTMKAGIEATGFINVQEQSKKFPIGTWPKDGKLKEVGRVMMNAVQLGLEGYAMFLLTHFGSPKPWTPEEVQLLLLGLRNDLDNRRIHSYTPFRRVWAQKPLDAK